MWMRASGDADNASGDTAKTALLAAATLTQQLSTTGHRAQLQTSANTDAASATTLGRKRKGCKQMPGRRQQRRTTDRQQQAESKTQTASKLTASRQKAAERENSKQMSGRQQQYNRRVTVNHIDVFVVCGLCGASDPAPNPALQHADSV